MSFSMGRETHCRVLLPRNPTLPSLSISFSCLPEAVSLSLLLAVLTFLKSFNLGLSDVTDETEVCTLGEVTTEAVCPAASQHLHC